MNTIDPDLKDRLMSALEASVEVFNSGSTPVEAVYKAADAEDFNIEQTRRLCEMFNTARTLYHYTANPEKRAERFEVVDPDQVIEKLFARSNVGKKLAHSDLEISEEYFVPERDPAIQKAASLSDDSFLDLVEDTPTEEEQIGRVMRRALSDKRAAAHAADEADIASMQAWNLAHDLARRVKYAFDIGDTGSYEYLARNSTLTGLLASDLPRYIQEHAVPKLAFNKSVEVNPVAERWMHELAEIDTLLQKSANLLAAASDLEKYADEFMRDNLDTLNPPPPAPDEFDSMLDNASKEANAVKTADSDGPDFLELGTRTVGGVRKALEEPTEPARKAVGAAASDYISTGLKGLLRDKYKKDNEEVSDYLKHQQQSIMFEELVRTDPVLSEVDPQQLSDAYLTILDLAPEVAYNKAIVRSMLRQMVHSDAFSVFDADNLTRLEKTLEQVRGKLPQGSRGQGEDA